MLAGYLIAAARGSGARGHRTARRWSPLATAAFVAGMSAVWAATGSGLDAHADTDGSAHVLQHVMLMMVAAPLLVAGRPLTLLCRALPRGGQVRLVRLLHGRALRLLTSAWLTWPLYVVSMFAYWLCRPVYEATLRDPALHAAVHAGFFVIGLLYWQPLVGDGSGARLPAHPVRILAVFLTMPFEMLLGVGITLLPYPLDPGAPLGANRAAGQLFWITAMLCSGLTVGAMSIDWLARDERVARHGPSGITRSSPTPA